MFINRRTDYGVRIMLEVARSGRRVSSRHLGGVADVPYPFARSIVTDLVSAGLLDARRGPGGGVVLARPAGQVSLLEIVEAIDGPVALNPCVTDHDCCNRVDGCPVHVTWEDASSMLASYLGTQDLASMAVRTASLPGAE